MRCSQEVGDETGGGGEAWLGLCNPLWQPPQHLLRLNPSSILRDNRKRARLGQQDNKILDTSLEIWCPPPRAHSDDAEGLYASP